MTKNEADTVLRALRCVANVARDEELAVFMPDNRRMLTSYDRELARANACAYVAEAICQDHQDDIGLGKYPGTEGPMP